ncbi:MAG: DUF255 domain-containing protein, partial [Campylobacterota bacterium]|nr:DUF255 domain-containing protein [Campylobacterota bacterium]
FNGRRNGWPLNAILTPDLEVLHVTTYIPPTFNYGTDGLDTLLDKYVNIFNDKKELEKLISKNKKSILKKDIFIVKNTKNIEQQYIDEMSKVYDNGFKGFFKRPRFPHAANLELLYDIYDLTKNKLAIKMVYEPLTAMAKGGIYDQIEGAFYRYSVQPDWMIPHFEKMLYTTAELVPLYARAYNDTKDELYKKVVVESLDQIEKRFMKNGLFYSASDADSNGKEGEYFIYKFDEAFNVLLSNGYTKDEAEYNLEYMDITSIGNFEEDLSNPHFNNNFEEDTKPKNINKTIKILKNMRKDKEYPFIDKKVITSWNAMMIKAYLIAGVIDTKYAKKGLSYLDKLLKKLYTDEKLYHFYIEGYAIKDEALLEDHAFLIDTLLYAYTINYDEKYLKLAKKLTKKSLKKFYKNKTWYLSDNILKSKANFNDRYYTSALGQMFENLITIANYNYDMELLYKTKKMIQNYKNQILSDISNHSSGIKSILRIEKGDIILKSNKNNLQQYKKNIQNIKYPFLYTKKENEKDFLACDESTCFGYSLEFNKIEKMINKHIID